MPSDGKDAILAALCKYSIINRGEISSDGAFTVEEVLCLCLCDHAPAALMDQMPCGNLGITNPRGLLGFIEEIPYGTICGAPCCLTARYREYSPENLDTYLKLGGFAGLEKALMKMEPAEVINEVKESELVGRKGLPSQRV